MLAGVFFAVVGGIGFSGKAIIIKLAYRHGVDPTTLIALRMVMALPFFLCAAWWMQRRASGQSPLQPGDPWRFLYLGFIGYYLSSYIDFLGLQYISANLERLILYLNPTVVLLFTVLIYKRRASAAQVFALGLSYAGVVLAFIGDFRVGGSNVALGGVLVLASVVLYAWYLIASGELVRRVGAIRLVSFSSAVACGFCIAQFLVTRPLDILSTLPVEVYWLSAINALACTVLPVFALMLAVDRIGAAAASQIGMVGPVSTIILSMWILGEPMTLWQGIGMVLVITGVYIVSRSKMG